jgi:hypothetical protein
MVTVNKPYIIKYISNLIITYLNSSSSIDYNIIKKDKLKLYLAKRKNKFIYIDNLLKRDKQLQQILCNNNIYYSKNTFKIGIKIKKKKKDFSNLNLTNLNCPYNILISNFSNKNIDTFSKTSEKVLNYKLNRNLFLKKFIKDINISIKKLSFYRNNEYISVLMNNSQFFSLNNTKYQYYKSNYFQKHLSTFSKIYPFRYFNYNNIILMSYILIKLNKYNEAKYIIVLLFDNIIDKLKIKYFNNIKLINEKIFDMFFLDKINQMKLMDYKLIDDYYKISQIDFNFISFSIGLYKLITYLKNKYNREIKNISVELYNTSAKIVNIVNINDSTINNI